MYKKIIVFLILSLVFISLSIFFYFFYNKPDSLETLNFTEKSYIDYNVCLKDNKFYEQKCQIKGMSYIASAIDYVDVYFNYTFETDQKLKYNYNYYIDGVITVFDKNDSNKILFSKKVSLLENQNTKRDNINFFTVDEHLKIDYSYYNNLIKTFKSEYNVVADSNIILYLHIDITGKYSKFSELVKKSAELELTIPLTENTITINMNYNDANTSDKFIQRPNTKKVNALFLAFVIVCVLLSIVDVFLLIGSILSIKRKKSKYENFIDNKIKNLDRMIVSAKENVKIEEKDYKEIIDVKEFNELVDIADREVNVITWTEVEYKNNLKVSWFTVASDTRLYRIIYNSTDKEFK